MIKDKINIIPDTIKEGEYCYWIDELGNIILCKRELGFYCQVENFNLDLFPIVQCDRANMTVIPIWDDNYIYSCIKRIGRPEVYTYQELKLTGDTYYFSVSDSCDIINLVYFNKKLEFRNRFTLKSGQVQAIMLDDGIIELPDYRNLKYVRMDKFLKYL